ncbi:MAG: DNA polymerase III subunit [Erysipelotrichaceae bacterium]|nr:DNA polymerase III subunit [Erysipelotrichaceae bacterium]
MIKEILKEKETVAYLSLRNDLRNGHLAHTYLLYGEADPLKKDTAFLLAQSIIEGKNDFACETCNTCRRIKEGSYFDVIYVDGYRETIKKEHIERIMDEMSKTSLEEAGRKVYIINNINNSTPKVLNMILKFMEEPDSSDVYGIIITDNIDALLPTLVSRCQKIPFTTRDFSFLISEYEKKGFEHTDAYLLSHIRHELTDVDKELFDLAREFVFRTVDHLDDREYLPVLFAREFIPALGKDRMKEGTDYYLDIFMKMLEDAGASVSGIGEEYDWYTDKLQKYDQGKLMEIILNARDRCRAPVNRAMLFDQIAAKIIL